MLLLTVALKSLLLATMSRGPDGARLVGDMLYQPTFCFPHCESGTTTVAKGSTGMV